jgi:hypothetical protein
MKGFVTVTAKSAGPAVWHVTRGSADVAILGVVEPLPEKFTWNTKPLECVLELSPLVTALDKRAIDDTVRDITAELDKGGHAVAVVSIGLLLKKNGVMEKLLGAGVTVEGPKE